MYYFVALFRCTHEIFEQGGDPQKRNENDAAALQAKVAAKKALGDQQQLQSNSSNGTVPRKKVTDKKVDTFDDLLNAGLYAGKKGKIAA